MRICSFLWSYYGYPTSSYEGVNVEVMRCKNGEIMAEHDEEEKFKNLQPYIIGGQAERICTSFAPLS